MPPKRVQDQPRIDDARSLPSIEEIVEGSDEDLFDEQYGLRAGHNEKLRRPVQEKGKLPITFNKCDGRPIGNYAAMFTTELGLAVKTFAPLKVNEWKEITEEQKRPMFDRLLNSFDVDFSTGPDSVKKQTDTWMGDQYRDNRSKWHLHYKQYKKKLRTFCGDNSDWVFLCSLWESGKFKEKSTRNATNRAQLAINHCGGSKSFVRHSYEAGEGPEQVNRIVLYKKMHFNEHTKVWKEGAEAYMYVPFSFLFHGF